MRFYKMYMCFILCFFLGCTSISTNNKSNNLDFKVDVLNSERDYLKKNPEEYLGLSLSGGGIRSSSFSIGLMAGLSKEDILGDFDYISSVSGGSYAAFWYYTKLYWYQNKKFEEDFNNIFEMCYPSSFKSLGADKYYTKDENGHDISSDGKPLSNYRFQNHLKHNTTIGRNWSAKKNQNLDPLVTFGARGWRGVASLPFLLLDSLQISRITQNNYSLLPDYYRNSIERIYGFYPDVTNEKGFVREGHYINRGNQSYRLEKFNYNSIQDLYTKNLKLRKTPIWIINTTADVNNRWPRWTNTMSQPPKYRDAIFEFTPFYYGNEYYGYSESTNFKKNISEIIQISGAAVDSANPYNSFGLTVGGIIAPLGDYVNIGEESVYLTDGGHSENLGVYSLIKRGVNRIVISDAEYDKDGNLEGLKRLKNKLDKDNIEIKIEGLHLGKGEKNNLKTNDPKGELLPMILKGQVTLATGKKIEIYYVKLRLIKKL